MGDSEWAHFVPVNSQIKYKISLNEKNVQFKLNKLYLTKSDNQAFSKKLFNNCELKALILGGLPLKPNPNPQH